MKTPSHGYLPGHGATLPGEAGLTVHWAPPEHLLAMKLVAMRPQDAPDIVALAQHLGLGTDAAAYADLLERVYDGEDALQQVLGVPYPTCGPRRCVAARSSSP